MHAFVPECGQQSFPDVTWARHVPHRNPGGGSQELDPQRVADKYAMAYGSPNLGVVNGLP
jgi:hypothetical protein